MSPDDSWIMTCYELRERERERDKEGGREREGERERYVFYCRDYIASRRHLITAIRSLDSTRFFLMRLYDHAKHAVEWLPTPNGGDVRKASYPYQSQIMLSHRYQAGLRSI